MLQPNEFYQLLEEFYASKKRIEPMFRLGTVDNSYTTGLPKVKLDGDDTVTVKEYSHIRNYSPTAGDRVMLALVGNTYIILGRLRNDPLQTPDSGGGSTPTSVTWSDVTGKPTTFPPSSHTHPISDVTGLQTALDGKASTSHTHAWSDITGKPTTFAPSEHTHIINDVTGLQTALDGKSATTHTHTTANITDFPSQTGNAGKFLQTDGTNLLWVASSTSVDWSAITGKPSTFPPSTHSHAWADITSKPWTVSGSDLTQTAGNYIMGASTGSVYAYALRPKVDTDNMLIRSNSEVRAYQATSTTYVPVRASSFPTGSSVNYKTNLEKLDDVYEPLEMIKSLQPFKYHLKGNVEMGIYDKPKVGFISEMVDPIFRDEDGVDVYTISAMNVGATQKLEKRVAELELTVEKQAEMIETLITLLGNGG